MSITELLIIKLAGVGAGRRVAIRSYMRTLNAIRQLPEAHGRQH